MSQPNNPDQGRLVDPAPPIGPNNDFLDLFPSRVMPTTMAVLEQGRNLLIIKHYPLNGKISRKQDEIFRLLTMRREGAGYSNPDSPGRVTVTAVIGRIGPRQVRIYEAGDAVWKAMSIEELRRFWLDWFNEARRSGR